MKKIILAFLCIMAICSVNALGYLSDNLISCYPLSNANDIMDTHEGTNSNNPTYGVGKLGNGVTFNSANAQSILLANAFNFSVASISFWYKFTALDDYTFFSLGYDPYQWKIGVDSTGHFLFVTKPNSGAYRSWVTNAVYNSTIWKHFTLTHDGTESEPLVYIDSVPVSVTLNGGNISGNITGTINQLGAIGRSGTFANYYLKGSVDDLSVWDRMLTSDEVVTIYNGGIGLGCSSFINTSTCVSPTGFENDFNCHPLESPGGEVYTCNEGIWVNILSCPTYRYCYNISSSDYNDVCSPVSTTTTIGGTTTTTTTITTTTTTSGVTTTTYVPLIGVTSMNLSSSLVDVTNATEAIDTSDASKARGLLPDIYFGILAFFKPVLFPLLAILVAICFLLVCVALYTKLSNA